MPQRWPICEQPLDFAVASFEGVDGYLSRVILCILAEGVRSAKGAKNQKSPRCHRANWHELHISGAHFAWHKRILAERTSFGRKKEKKTVIEKHHSRL